MDVILDEKGWAMLMGRKLDREEIQFVTGYGGSCLHLPSIVVAAMCDTPDEAVVGLDHTHMRTCTVERRFGESHTLHRCDYGIGNRHSHNVYVIWEG